MAKESPKGVEQPSSHPFQRGVHVKFYKLDNGTRPATASYEGSLIDEIRVGEQVLFNASGGHGHLSVVSRGPMQIQGRWVIQTKNSRYELVISAAPKEKAPPKAAKNTAAIAAQTRERTTNVTQGKGQPAQVEGAEEVPPPEAPDDADFELNLDFLSEEGSPNTPPDDEIRLQ